MIEKMSNHLSEGGNRSKYIASIIMPRAAAASSIIIEDSYLKILFSSGVMDSFRSG